MKHDRIKQQIRGLKRGRLLVLENLPVPEDYRGLKTDDLLDWFEETEPVAVLIGDREPEKASPRDQDLTRGLLWLGASLLVAVAVFIFVMSYGS